ncbi:MAG TPA: exopolysaccharide biosynthesis protein [Thermoanaerobaculia bacterium]|nr:exopolysaccharide biosynthesis protein [Thermoanaerobaculia bacterium]
MSLHPLRSLTSLLRKAVDADETVTFGELLRRTGIETFGPVILVLALLSLIPYASVLTGVGLIVLGVGMLGGRRVLRVPGWLLRWRMRGRHIHASLGSLERVLRLFGSGRPGRGWVVGDRLIGGLVAWSGFVMALPMPLIPFNNFLPAVGLALLGLAAMERRPALVGAGALFSFGGTLYFVLVGQAAFTLLGWI